MAFSTNSGRNRVAWLLLAFVAQPGTGTDTGTCRCSADYDDGEGKCFVDLQCERRVMTYDSAEGDCKSRDSALCFLNVAPKSNGFGSRPGFCYSANVKAKLHCQYTAFTRKERQERAERKRKRDLAASEDKAKAVRERRRIGTCKAIAQCPFRSPHKIYGSPDGRYREQNIRVGESAELLSQECDQFIQGKPPKIPSFDSLSEAGKKLVRKLADACRATPGDVVGDSRDPWEFHPDDKKLLEKKTPEADFTWVNKHLQGGDEATAYSKPSFSPSEPARYQEPAGTPHRTGTNRTASEDRHDLSPVEGETR